MNPLQMQSNPGLPPVSTPVNIIKGITQDPITPGGIFKSGIIGLLRLFQSVFSFVVFVISTVFSFLSGLLFLLPTLIQFVLFILFLYVINKIWGLLRLIYNPAAKGTESMVRKIVSGWNRTAGSINRLVRKKILPTGNANVNLPKMPDCIDFVILIIRPLAKGIQKTFHKAIYE